VSDRAGYALIAILVTSVFGGLVYSAGDEPQTPITHLNLRPSAEPYTINVKENTNMTTVSTELINYSGFTAGNIDTWIALCTAQGLTEFTLRIPAYTDFLDGALDSTYETVSKAIIADAVVAGIDVNIDLHTWYTTWDTYFRDSASNAVTYREKHFDYIADCVEKLDVEGVASFMVLNEPQARAASSTENTFILNCISTAQSHTTLPVSVRFMMGYSPTTGHYASSINSACDFLARNTYWDPRYPATSVYGTTEAKMKADIATATAQGKELWITEFGKAKTNTEEQRAYVEAFVTYAKNNDIDKVFCWASQPSVTGETYNIFSGFTPLPAWYELDSSAVPPNDTNLLPITAWNMQYDTAPYIYFYPDTDVQHDGSNSIRSEPHTSADVNHAREINSGWIPVKPGDRILFRAWVKTATLTNTDHTTGGRIGIDFYCGRLPAGVTVGVVDGQPHGYYYIGGAWYSRGDASYVDGAWDYANYQTFDDVPLSDFLLPWGNDWTQLEWDVFVPTKVYTQNYEADAIEAQQICGIIAWMDCRNVGDAANAWFADTELYINPTGINPPETVTIAASSDDNCSLSEEGNVAVPYGGSKTFTYNLAEGYIIDTILVDGGAVGNTGSYTFLNCVANHTIAITSKLGSPAEVNIKTISHALRMLNGE
jgi:hypothetical protein